MTVVLPHLDRAIIRARIAAVPPLPVTDMSLSDQLLAEGNLQTFVDQGFSGIAVGLKRSQLPPQEKPRTPAAVLVPLIEHAEGFTVLLTQRTDMLRRHAGQVAFPGGRMDPEDASPEACALREAREETGLDPASVELIGRLRPYVTGSGYEMTPVVGIVTPPVAIVPDPSEVAAAFEVPLAFFLDAANHQRVVRDFDGVKAAYYAMPYGDRYIWGATAAILLSLYQALVIEGAAPRRA